MTDNLVMPYYQLPSAAFDRQVLDAAIRQPGTWLNEMMRPKAYVISLGNGYGKVEQEIDYRQLWGRYTEREYERLLRGTWEHYPRWTHRLLIAPSYQMSRFELDLLTQEIGIWEGERQRKDRRRLADGYEYSIMCARDVERRIVGLWRETEYIPIWMDEWSRDAQDAVLYRLTEAATVSRLEIEDAKMRVLQGEHLSWAIHSHM